MRRGRPSPSYTASSASSLALRTSDYRGPSPVTAAAAAGYCWPATPAPRRPKAALSQSSTVNDERCPRRTSARLSAFATTSASILTICRDILPFRRARRLCIMRTGEETANFCEKRLPGYFFKRETIYTHKKNYFMSLTF